MGICQAKRNKYNEYTHSQCAQVSAVSEYEVNKLSQNLNQKPQKEKLSLMIPLAAQHSQLAFD